MTKITKYHKIKIDTTIFKIQIKRNDDTIFNQNHMKYKYKKEKKSVNQLYLK